MKDALFAAAREAMANSHSPYSRFPVGAALLSGSGAIFSGCNIENASYPEGWCAETSAISHLITAGEKQITEILVVAEKKDRATPCGGCRQRLIEFASPQTPVHLCDQQGIVETITLGDLLPASFDLD
ncbi:MAG: cytidine deaminase [Rhizobiaceae bacterium]